MPSPPASTTCDDSSTWSRDRDGLRDQGCEYQSCWLAKLVPSAFLPFVMAGSLLLLWLSHSSPAANPRVLNDWSFNLPAPYFLCVAERLVVRKSSSNHVWAAFQLVPAPTGSRSLDRSTRNSLFFIRWPRTRFSLGSGTYLRRSVSVHHHLYQIVTPFPRDSPESGRIGIPVGGLMP